MASHEIEAGSDAYTLVCNPCHRDKKPVQNVQAVGYCQDCHEHLCQQCFNSHTRSNLTMNHILEDKDSMPETQQLYDSLTTPCVHHSSKMIKFYCHDHNVLICSVCLTQEHTKCNASFIPDISGNIRNSREYQAAIDKTEQVLHKCDEIQSNTTRNINTSNESLKKALDDVTHYRLDINQRLDKIQSELENKIQVVQQQNLEKMEAVKVICGDIRTKLERKGENLKELHASAKSDQLFFEVTNAQKDIQAYERSLRSLRADDDTKEYKFIPSQAIKDTLLAEKMIGNISSIQQETPSFGSSCSLTPLLMDSLQLKTLVNSATSDITGITMLYPDKLVLCDWKNHLLKVIDVNTKKVFQASFGPDDKDVPCDVTAISKTEVAVTMIYRKQIQIVTVDDKLHVTNTIPTDGKCRGICCFDDKLVVTYLDPKKLEILNLKGEVISAVTTSASGDAIFGQPGYVHATNSSIYVSDKQLRVVFVINWNGKITGRIAGIKDPRGLTQLDDGSLLVCNKAGNSLHHIIGGEVTLLPLHDVKRPAAICTNTSGNIVYICTKTDDSDSIILIYSI